MMEHSIRNRPIVSCHGSYLRYIISLLFCCAHDILNSDNNCCSFELCKISCCFWAIELWFMAFCVSFVNLLFCVLKFVLALVRSCGFNFVHDNNASDGSLCTMAKVTQAT